MTTKQLDQLRQHHQALADAYAQGVKAAENTRLSVSGSVIYLLEHALIKPGTCINPKPALSRHSRRHNNIIEGLITDLNVSAAEDEKNLSPNPQVDDDIPF